jgi:hypothetical protein
MERQPCTANDQINLAIVRGLLIVEAIVVSGIVGCMIARIPVDNSLIILATNIAAGFLGYLSREYKNAQASAVASGNIEHVNVESPAVENTEKTEE